MNKNKKIGLIVGGVVVLGAVFYGGMLYGKSQIPQRGQGGAQFSALGARGGRGAAGGFTTGKIIAQDAKSITVQLTNGGSKIIFLGTTTKVSKTVDGTTSDLATGTEVSVTGTPNTDGSINAQTVQIRPNMPTTTTAPAVVQ